MQQCTHRSYVWLRAGPGRVRASPPIAVGQEQHLVIRVLAAYEPARVFRRLQLLRVECNVAQRPKSPRSAGKPLGT